jgi:general secretion pathway protein D
MKNILLVIALVFASLQLGAQPSPGIPNLPGQGNNNPSLTKPLYAPLSGTPATTAAPMDDISKPDEIIPAGLIDFRGVDVSQVLDIYAQLVGRTLLRANLPAASIVLKTQTPLTKKEAIEALQAVLALNGIAVINVGDKFVKVVPVADANAAGAQITESSATNIPNLGSYITHIVQLHYVKPSDMVPVLTPFAKLNSIIPLDGNGILIIRDYAENVKRMLEMIERVDVSVPTEFISEVIPIRYAEATDIANALNSLGGSGGSTVSFGSSSSRGSVSGLRGGSTGSSLGSGFGGSTSGFGGNNYSGQSANQTRPFGAAGAPNASTTGTTFQQRLQSIISKASGTGGGGSGQDQIQLFGQTKIIADERSNSLLVFATRADMEHIKEVISQLDVLLAQVLIESIIMDVGLGHTLNAGVSAVQHPQQFNNSNVAGGGIMNNGTGSFLNFIQSAATNNIVNNLTNSGSGLSYLTSIGNTWDIAVQAAESDTSAHIIQRPRIQTSQAKPAQFFVGQTVPYVTSSYNNAYNGGYGGSSYSQLSVGVELDVTPFINPDGLVVMDIQQEIDEISGYTLIDNNKVPNTIKRTLSSEIAVRNRDTVILGGFVRSDKSHNTSGVPLLKDIPLLGWLFRSTDDSKDRTELLVMMRPTVLQTPALAAAQTIKEAQRLPGVSAAAVADEDYTRKLVEAERKKELKNAKKGQSTNDFQGFFNMNTEADEGTNGPAPSEQPVYNYNVSPATSQANQTKAQSAMEQKMNELQLKQPPVQPPPSAPPQ